MADASARIDVLIDRLRAVLTGIGAPELLPALSGPAAEPAPTTLRVLASLDALFANAPAATREAVQALREAAADLTWRQTYGPDAGRAFLDNYGWTELAGAKGFRRETAFSAGLLILGPHTDYPPHLHQPLEHYVPLSGTAGWYDEDRGWRPVAPLSVIVHRPMVRHAMRTGPEPLLAYYLWSGDGIGSSARMAG